MPDIGRALREEIIRLGRKEIRAAVQPFARQVRGLKKRVREQDQEIRALRKALDRKADRPARVAPADGDEGDAIRIPTGSIKKHRERLGLSQREMALLMGVSTISIGNWETGRAAPRGQNRAAFAELREMGRRQASGRLEELE